MVSSAFCYADGKEVWKVTHDSDIGLTHLEERGSLPSIYPQIKQQLLAEQETSGADEGVDYVFDVPVLLAYEVVGYRHDNVYVKSGEEALFNKLVRSNA